MKHHKFLKPTVLSVSLLTVLSGAAVSPALGQIKNAFPHTSDLMIQMILTLPPLLIIPFSLLTGRLATLFPKKNILYTGLVIYVAAGVGGGLANTIPVLLIMRGLLGVGTGLIAPLSLTLIADFYEGEARADMMGKSSAVATFGGIVMPLLSGWLAVYNWRYAFGAYLVALLVFLLIFRYLPEPPKSENQPKKHKIAGRCLWSAWGYVFCDGCFLPDPHQGRFVFARNPNW